MKHSVLCDIVQQNYPDVLEAVTGLSRLKNAAKLELMTALKDVGTLRNQIGLMGKVTAQGSFCDEDRWVL